jgi:6-pyruvoyltetrahydropterin/6-carboxytetrahydropterin synthase
MPQSDNEHLITRRIEIDAGHRIPEHGSKCRGLHGHRYVIIAGVVAPLQTAGSETDMAMDFGFLKRIMMEEIHDPCDHAMILKRGDPWLEFMLGTDSNGGDMGSEWDSIMGNHDTKLYLIPAAPTAERLAEHWFYRLRPRVKAMTGGRGRLAFVKVQETPNCEAVFSPR